MSNKARIPCGMVLPFTESTRQKSTRTGKALFCVVACYGHCRVFYLESKITLRDIAEHSYDSGGEHFGRRGEQVTVFHKQFQEHVVQQNTHAYQQCIAKQLYTSVEIGLGKYDVFR